MIIHTVYKPEENYKYLKEWLDHHTAIGVKHFYLYDNQGSIGDYNYYSKDIKLNKYGFLNGSIKEALEFENKFINNYPVTKIEWQPKNQMGQVIYDQNGAIIDFISKVNEGLCAFIDIDEFLIKKENFYPSRLKQKKFKSRNYFNSVSEITECVDVNTELWATKTILDLSKINKDSFKDCVDFNIHFECLDLPFSQNYFNHYNHNEFANDWLNENYMRIDKNWQPKSYAQAFNKIDKKDIGLMIY